MAAAQGNDDGDWGQHSSREGDEKQLESAYINNISLINYSIGLDVGAGESGVKMAGGFGWRQPHRGVGPKWPVGHASGCRVRQRSLAFERQVWAGGTHMGIVVQRPDEIPKGVRTHREEA